MGCLYELPGPNFVAQQSGRNGAASTFSFLLGQRCPSSMVARWEADCIRWQNAPQQEIARLYRVGRWWSA